MACSIDAQEHPVEEGTLATLLTLEQEARTAPSLEALQFVIVNRTWELARYRIAILFTRDALGRWVPGLASGLLQLEGDSPFAVWLSELYKAAQPESGAARAATLNDYPELPGDSWHEWLPEYLLWLPLRAPDGQTVGVLALAREEAWHAHEIGLLETLMQGYAHALWAWRPARRSWQSRRWQAWWGGKRARFILLAVTLLLLFPFRQSVVATAEVTPLAPVPITAPADVPIRQVLVRPGQTVEKDQVLAILDDTLYRNRLAVARKTQEIIQADWLRASQRGFQDDASRSDTGTLRAKIDENRAEVAFLEELLQRIELRAPARGVVSFDDPLGLIGKPVVIGERIMLLADPAKVAVTAWVPVQDAIAVAPGGEMKLTLYVNPLGSYEARLTETGFAAEARPDGVAAYRMRGEFTAGQTLPTLGFKGTARLYGARAPLLYQIVRRPLFAVRRLLGW